MDFVIRPELVQPLPGRSELKVVIRGEQTGGVMSAIEQTLGARAFITPHTHANDVWVLVQSGVIGALVGETVGEAAAGQWILKPRDVPHAMWNPTDEPARILEVLTPAGTEKWFEELGELDPEDPDAFADSCRRYGLAFDANSPWTERLRTQFGLR